MDQENSKKRKTHTSSKVKQRYYAKTYTPIVVHVKKEIAAEYKQKCDEMGISYSQLLHEAINNFLGKEE